MRNDEQCLVCHWCGRGVGGEVALAALAADDKVVITARNVEQLSKAYEGQAEQE